jgi:hypothetical protein
LPNGGQFSEEATWTEDSKAQSKRETMKVEVILSICPSSNSCKKKISRANLGGPSPSFRTQKNWGNGSASYPDEKPNIQNLVGRNRLEPE